MLILAYEVWFHKLSFVFLKRVRGNIVKNDGGAIMMVVFAIVEISGNII